MWTHLKRLKHTARVAVACGALAICTQSFAYTQCTGHVVSIYTGDNGGLWVIMDNTVPWYLGPTDPNFKNILSSATTALVTGYTVTTRFDADGLTCAAGDPRSDVHGMYLNNAP